MNAYRKLEIGCGVATVVLSMAAMVIVQVPRMIPELMRQQLFETAFLSDASGIRYGWIFDAIRRKPFGRVMLWLGGLYLTFSSFVVGLFGGVFLFFGLWGGLAVIAPSVPAIGSMVASVLIIKSGSRK
jgi:hypothetical protein